MGTDDEFLVIKVKFFTERLLIREGQEEELDVRRILLLSSA